jgi:hypothetical protein
MTTNETPSQPVADPWLEHNLSQLRYFRSLSLREKLQAVEGMADIVRRLDAIRRTERIRANESGSEGNDVPPARPHGAG